MNSEVRKQRDYYTDRWSEFSYKSGFDLIRLIEVLKILQSLEFTTPLTICDLGCGSGWVTGILSCFGPTLGVDLSDTTRARQLYPTARFVSANLMDWNHPQGAFDVVVSVEVIEHIERARQQQYIRIAHDLLKTGGHLILTTPNARTMNAFAQGGREFSNQPIEDWLTRRELATLLSDGFEIVSLTSALDGLGSRGSYRVVNSPKLRGLLNRVGMGKMWQRLALQFDYGLHLVACARKRSAALPQ